MPIQTLSYSKTRTFKSCSALYYYTYLHEPRLPRSENTGALIGGIVHEVSEVLGNLNRRHRGLVNKINTTSTVPKSIKRLFQIKLKKVNILSDENLEKCINYLICYLKYDFWFDGADFLLPPEFEFNIKTETLWIKGFLDRAAIYRDKDGIYYVRIVDLKTQKELFKPDEIENSIQGLSYLMAAKDKYPEIDLLKSSVEFIMVAHDTKQTFKLKNIEQYDNFIAMMEEYQVKIDQFNHSKIKSNLAWTAGYPTDKTFSGKLMCGIGCYKAGELKKDGITPKYHCTFRFPFHYYVGTDKEGKEVYRHKEKPDKKKLNLVKVERKFFGGCCAFNTESLINKGGKGLDL